MRYGTENLIKIHHNNFFVFHISAQKMEPNDLLKYFSRDFEIRKDFDDVTGEVRDFTQSERPEVRREPLADSRLVSEFQGQRDEYGTRTGVGEYCYSNGERLVFNSLMH
jgi:hypothetical protein